MSDSRDGTGTIPPDAHPVPPKKPKRRPIRPRKRARGGPRPRVRIPYWTAVPVAGGRENWAKKNIESQGLRVFAPLIRKPGHRWRTEAMFPGYLFVEIIDRWSMLRGTFGVIGLLTRGDRLERVPTKWIDAMRAQQDEEGIVTLPHQRPLVPGEAVEIEVGSFQNQIGVYITDTPGDRIRVLFEFMGQQVPYEIERHKVTPVKV